jgi:sporulation protein YlmC with PRC-barrel domain
MARFSVTKLAEMPVVTDKGLVVGEIVDLIVDELSGKITYLVVKKAKSSAGAFLQKLRHDKEGNILIPYPAVKHITEMVVLDEKFLRIHALTKG